MEVDQGSREKVGFFSWWFTLIALLEKLHARVANFFCKMKKIGEDDPRRILHCIKVGFALTLVSIVYYVTPLFDGFGSSAIWAVLTVVVVMEYTVGGTLGKGLNRAFASVFAAALGVGAHYMARDCGKQGEPILLGVSVFLLASMATFLRFIPAVKRGYDYGVTIFILTFCLVAVSSYRAEEIIRMAHQRLSTIAVGVASCIGTTIFVFPVWAGEDLHLLAASNLEKLASFLEGLGNKYFQEKAKAESSDDKSYLKSHTTVLNAKATEEALANFARWEPGHGKFGFRHPWSQYLKLGASTRRCAYSMDALAALISTFEKSTTCLRPDPNPQPYSDDLGNRIRSACADMSTESAKSLSDLSAAIKSMSAPLAARQHIAAASAAAERLKKILSDGSVTVDVIHVAAIGSLVMEIVRCAHEVVGAVEELARLGGFKGAEASATVKPVADENCPHVVITVE